MTTLAFFRWTLLLPIVGPLCAIPFAMGEGLGVVPAVGSFLLGSLLCGGVPYACFAFVLAVKLRHLEPRRVIALAWWVPVRFAWIQGLFTAAAFVAAPLIDGREERAAPWVVAVWAVTLALFAAGLGWVYVGLALLLHWVCRGLSIVHDRPETLS